MLVFVITLEKFCDENKIDNIVYIHTDTQGSDLNVLQGMATDGDGIWCADRADKIVVKYEKSTGKEMERVELPEKGPDPHGLSIKDGVLWYSDADFPVAEGMRGYPEIGMVVD